MAKPKEIADLAERFDADMECSDLVNMPTLEFLSIAISALSLILVALNFKKIREVDLSVTLVDTSEWMGFPKNVEICIENVSNNFIPFAQAAKIKIYVDNKIKESNSENFSIKKGTANFIKINFVDVLKFLGIVDDRNSLSVSGADLENIRNNIKVYIHCQFSGYRLFGKTLPIFKKDCIVHLVWDARRHEWRSARSSELVEF